MLLKFVKYNEFSKLRKIEQNKLSNFSYRNPNLFANIIPLCIVTLIKQYNNKQPYLKRNVEITNRALKANTQAKPY